MMITIIAVVGWLLFLGMACLYFVGNRINARDENALASFGLAVIFSDAIRDATREGYARSVREIPAVDPKLTAWRLIQAIKSTAAMYYEGDAEVFSPTVVAQAVEQMRAE